MTRKREEGYVDYTKNVFREENMYKKKCRHPDYGIDEKTGNYICFICRLPVKQWHDNE